MDTARHSLRLIDCRVGRTRTVTVDVPRVTFSPTAAAQPTTTVAAAQPDHHTRHERAHEHRPVAAAPARPTARGDELQGLLRQSRRGWWLLRVHRRSFLRGALRSQAWSGPVARLLRRAGGGAHQGLLARAHRPRLPTKRRQRRRSARAAGGRGNQMVPCALGAGGRAGSRARRGPAGGRRTRGRTRNRSLAPVRSRCRRPSSCRRATRARSWRQMGGTPHRSGAMARLRRSCANGSCATPNACASRF